MRNSTVGKLALAVGVVGLAAGGLYVKEHYFDQVKMTEVHIEGLPCANGDLVTPIWIEGAMDGFKFGMTYTGGARRVMLPTGTKHEVTVRVGLCHAQGGDHWSCENPRWTDHKQVVTVDTAQPDPVVMKLALTSDHVCR